MLDVTSIPVQKCQSSSDRKQTLLISRDMYKRALYSSLTSVDSL